MSIHARYSYHAQNVKQSSLAQAAMGAHFPNQIHLDMLAGQSNQANEAHIYGDAHWFAA